jgi:transposase InsO family protein
MSRPANPYDNARCESFFKTLKREEIYANHYRDLDHLRRTLKSSSNGITTHGGFTRRWVIAHQMNSSKTP